MVSRSVSRVSKTISKCRNLTHATAILRTSSDVTQQVRCRVEGASYYSIVVPKGVGFALADRDLGRKNAKMDLIFHGGRHFACSP